MGVILDLREAGRYRAQGSEHKVGEARSQFFLGTPQGCYRQALSLGEAEILQGRGRRDKALAPLPSFPLLLLSQESFVSLAGAYPSHPLLTLWFSPCSSPFVCSKI